MLAAGMAKSNLRSGGFEFMERELFDFVVEGPAGGPARLVQIFLQFVLPVDGDGAPSSQLVHIDPVPGPAKADVDAMMHQPFTMHPRAESDRIEQVHGTLFEHAGPYAVDDIFLAARFEHHRV